MIVLMYAGRVIGALQTNHTKFENNKILTFVVEICVCESCVAANVSRKYSLLLVYIKNIITLVETEQKQIVLHGFN